ncbi:prolyl oligopeptidase family serine peptidase [uncultured Ramlibacter sp.]|uniref:alpha/beta hydrolase family protein n=1 Tax=uncultured Ramlibacter sp. TaxID=260755 RepID=UPI0026309178|nr:prolyl oligopeptidase family serine peptidase [uncultured Ramlibacter sp.]
MAIHRLVLALGAATLLALAGCSTAPTHPAIASAQQAGQLPPLLPVRRFVANIDHEGGFLLSPDGQRLLWSQAVGTDVGLATRPVAGGATTSFPTGVFSRRQGTDYIWLGDSRHAIYGKDPRGDENTQIHAFDTQAAFAPWVVTPWPGARSYTVARGAPGTAKFFFASNRRDKAAMDLYEADAATREVREVARSDGRILSWLIGSNHQLVGRSRQLGSADGSDISVELLQPDGSWRTLATVKAFDAYWLNRIDTAAGKAWGFSNLGRDKMALVEVALDSGRETVLAAHPEVDLDSASLPPLRGAPQAYTSYAGMPVVHWLDQALGAEVAAAVQRARAQGLLAADPVSVRPWSTAEDGRRMVLGALGDFDAAELLWDRATGQVTRLDPRDAEAAAWLAAERSYSFRASDGRPLHGYITRPRGVTGPAPLVVVIHGGPWGRDHWNPATFNTAQLLANRGYAVLHINYRSSSGYGREFLLAGNLEYWGRMQKDIAEAAQWAVDQKIADPTRMAVLGASFGGFSVMAQLAQKQQDWRCGVNVVGVANWPRVVENWPPFWRNRHMFEALLGDAKVPEQRARMLANSPISHVDAITAPMLVIHGANDIRVLSQDSDEVVARLRQLGRPVDYLSFPDEGHSVRRWRNRLEMWRRIDDTLAACLGGRSAGWDYYQLVPRQLGAATP